MNLLEASRRLPVRRLREQSRETEGAFGPGFRSERDAQEGNRQVQRDQEEALGSYGPVVTVTRVVDGDTIEVNPAIEGLDGVRLIGVDTPETSHPIYGAQPYGQQAKDFTVSRLEGALVALEFDVERTDRYGRLLASSLFLVGVGFGYLVVLPIGVDFLLSWDPERYAAIITPTSYFSFASRFLLAFGIVFELPAASYVGAKLGLIDAPLLRSHRRHALVINTVLAAVLTPGQDPFSMILMALPMVLMYELSSIIIARHVNPVFASTSLESVPRE